VRRILAVTGLNREAGLIASPKVVTLASGGVVATLEARIEAALTPEVVGVISLGLAGALDPQLEVGDAVIDGEPGWCANLAATLPYVKAGRIIGSDIMVVSAAAKAQLFQSSGALAVDMESHLASAVAARRGLRFAGLRFISDGADRALPKAAQVGMRPDGAMDIIAVLGSILRDPRQLPALIRTGLDAESAFNALSAARKSLGSGLGLL